MTHHIDESGYRGLNKDSMSLMVFFLLLLLRSTPSLCSAPFAPETFAQPFSFTQTMKKRPPPGNNAAQHTLGTTLLACSFINFTVIACDSRSSINGEIVANGGASKITVLPTRAAWSMKNSRMKEAGLGKDVVIARCGSTLVTQSLLEKLHRWSWHNTMQYNVCYSAKNIGKLLRHLILSLGGNIQSGFIVCDNSNIFTLEPSGAILHHTKPKSGLGYASLGSGSVHALGYISEHYDCNMTPQMAAEHCGRAILKAIERDGASGGRVRVYIVAYDRVREVEWEDRNIVGGTKSNQIQQENQIQQDGVV